MHDPWLFVLAACGYGVASAFIPVVNAEAFVIAGAASMIATAATAGVVALALGQTAGKVVIFFLARRGVEYSRNAQKKRAPTQRGRVWQRLATWSAALLTHLDRPVVGPAVVLCSAVVGLPPLAIVAVLAGTTRMAWAPFAAAVALGRLLRFGAIALPVILAHH